MNPLLYVLDLLMSLYGTQRAWFWACVVFIAIGLIAIGLTCWSRAGPASKLDDQHDREERGCGCGDGKQQDGRVFVNWRHAASTCICWTGSAAASACVQFRTKFRPC